MQADTEDNFLCASISVWEALPVSGCYEQRISPFKPARSEGCAEPLHGHAPAAEPVHGEKLCAATFHSAEGTLCKAMLENLSCIFPQAEIHRGLGMIEAILRQPPTNLSWSHRTEELFRGRSFSACLLMLCTSFLLVLAGLLFSYKNLLAHPPCELNMGLYTSKYSFEMCGH